MRKLASIQRIDQLTPIPGADNVELAHVLGYKVLVRKGEYKVGHLAVYVECDSVLPEWPDFEFMRQSKFRVKIKHFNKFNIYSQGLLFPLGVLKVDWSLAVPEVGVDVTDLLQIQKYEPPVKMVNGDMAGEYPTFIPKTDELRAQSYPELVTALQGQPARATLKCDGGSVTFYRKDEHIGCCFRNVEVKDGDNVLWNYARRIGLIEKLNSLTANVAFQGELCGQGYNGSGKYTNPMGISGHKVFFFSAFNIDTQTYLPEYQFSQLTTALDLDTVPQVAAWPVFNDTLDELLEMVKGLEYREGVPAEGIVVRNWVGDERVSFKVINPIYENKVENSK